MIIYSTVVHKEDDMDDPVFGTVVNIDGALVTVRWDDDDDIGLHNINDLILVNV